jgi:microsomal epoxide hydrolase
MPDLYWLAQTAPVRCYYEIAANLGGDLDYGPVTELTAIANFPADHPYPPRSFAERFFNIQRWIGMLAGGHFTVWEQPELLADDLRAFFLTSETRSAG